MILARDTFTLRAGFSGMKAKDVKGYYLILAIMGRRIVWLENGSDD